jgi:hypothetical protein
MKILPSQEGFVWTFTNYDDLLDELNEENVNHFVKHERQLEPGTTVHIFESDNPNPVAEFIIDRKTTVISKGFEEGLTSDHWMIFDDGTVLYLVSNEPMDLRCMDEDQCDLFTKVNISKFNSEDVLLGVM